MGMRLRISLDTKPLEDALTRYVAAAEALNEVSLDLKVEWVDDDTDAGISPELTALLQNVGINARLVRDDDEDEGEADEQ